MYIQVDKRRQVQYFTNPCLYNVEVPRHLCLLIPSCAHARFSSRYIYVKVPCISRASIPVRVLPIVNGPAQASQVIPLMNLSEEQADPQGKTRLSHLGHFYASTGLLATLGDVYQGTEVDK